MFKSRRKQKQSGSGKLFGALFGLAMFAGSFFLLWTNEGRINYADIAEDSLSVSASLAAQSFHGELIDIEGHLFSPGKINDPVFFEETSLIKLNRVVEMYAWEEKEITEDEETEYEYSSIWTDTPENSGDYYDSNIINPEMVYQSQSFTVPLAFIGIYAFDPSEIQFPDPQNVDLTNENIKNEIIQDSAFTLSNQYIYFGTAKLDSPEIGDLRISFTAISPQLDVTAFASVENGRLVSYTFGDDNSLFRLFFVDREQAILQMDEEYTAALWGSRFAGFALMWCGLFLILNPITIIISFLPLLERAGFWLLIAITFPVAAIISFLLVLFSFIAHNPFVLFGLIFLTILTIGIIAYSLYTADKRKKEEITS